MDKGSECGIKANIILFGAGNNGKKALEYFGEQVFCFADNNPKKTKDLYEGKKVLSFEQMIELYRQDRYRIVITPFNSRTMALQLKCRGIHDFILFSSYASNYQKDWENRERANEKQYKKLDSIVKCFNKWEFMQETVTLQESVKNLVGEQKLSGVIQSRYGESNYYGNMESIFSYAGINLKDAKYYPVITHNDMFQYAQISDIRNGLMIPGNRYKEFVHRFYSYVPVYTVGPYIHYVKGFYDKQKLDEVKKKYGKIVTIFLPHTTEHSEISYAEKEFIDKILALYKDKFDSVWACVYWADINRPICNYLVEQGIHIVSAGYRFDPLFNRRLKSIMEVTDAIVCGEGGTFIGNALYFDIPVGFIQMSAKHTALDNLLWETGDALLHEEGYAKVFNTELSITEEQREFINQVRGFDNIRNKEYFWHVLEISKDIWKFCNGEESRYPIGVYSAYDYYIKNDLYEKAIILREAVGDNFL